jgi:hypothetical protein
MGEGSSGSIKGVECIDRLNNYQLLKNGPYIELLRKIGYVDGRWKESLQKSAQSLEQGSIPYGNFPYLPQPKEPCATQ